MTAKRKGEEGMSFFLNIFGHMSIQALISLGYLGVFAGTDKCTEVYAKLLKFFDTTEHYRPDRLYGLLSEGGQGSLRAFV